MSLENFRDAFLSNRPFAADRVSEPRLDVPDVEELHDEAFRRILARAGEVHRQPTGRGVTVLGAAGVGKSHLLGRLFRWTRRPPGATAVFLHNLLVAPERLPRYVLNTTIGVLTNGRRGDHGETALYELWAAVVRRELKLSDEADLNLARARQALERFQDGGTSLDKAIRSVLLRVGLNMHHAHLEETGVNEAVIDAGLDWLSGERLEPDQVELLGLSKQVEVHHGLRDDQDVERVFKVMAELSHAAGRPFILCIDQFDNLSAEQVQATTRFLHVLVDHMPNFLCVLSGVTENVLELVDREIITSANWDRVAEERVDLKFATPAEALSIIRSRIDGFHAPLPPTPHVSDALAADPLFPLETEFFRNRIGAAVSVRPRQIIRWAKEEWDHQVQRCREQGVAQWLAERLDGPRGPRSEPTPPPLWEAVVDEVVTRQRAELNEVRLKNPGGLPPDDSNLVELLEILLGAAAEAGLWDISSVETHDSGLRRLVVKEATGAATRIAPIITNQAQRSTVAIKALAKNPSLDRRLILIEDGRRPIRRTEACERYLDALPRAFRRFDHVHFDLDAHAQLDSMVSVLRQARSGDLEVDWRGEAHCLNEEEVIQSLVRTKALQTAPILAVFAEPPSGSGGGGSTTRATGNISREPRDLDPVALDTFLLGLAAVRPWISVRNAANTWCTEHGSVRLSTWVEGLLTHAARRLSLGGRARCEEKDGSLLVSRSRRFDLVPLAAAPCFTWWI